MRPPLRIILEDVRPSGTHAGHNYFIVRPIPDFEKHYVGWDFRAAPCILIETMDAGFRAPLQLAGLEAQYAMPCDISLPEGKSETKTLTVITCTASDVAGQDYFLHLMDTVLRIVGPHPTLSAVVSAIARLVEILQQLARPPRRSVIGLYGELTVIAVGNDPVACLSAWRSDIDDRFDFSLGNVRLEAKATSERVRAHMFSFEQCSPPNGTHGVIASMFVEPNGGGQSIEEILAEIISRLHEDQQARLKLQSTVASSLGTNLLAALSMRFDQALARSTILFFDALSIPAIRSHLPLGVNQVRFRSDLSGVAPGSIEILGSQSAQLRQLLPRGNRTVQ